MSGLQRTESRENLEDNWVVIWSNDSDGTRSREESPPIHPLATDLDEMRHRADVGDSTLFDTVAHVDFEDLLGDTVSISSAESLGDINLEVSMESSLFRPRKLDQSPPLRGRKISPLSRPLNPFHVPEYRRFAEELRLTSQPEPQNSFNVYQALECGSQFLCKMLTLLHSGWIRVNPFSSMEGGELRPAERLQDFSRLTPWECRAKQICYEIEQWRILLKDIADGKAGTTWPKYPIKVGIGIQLGEIGKVEEMSGVLFGDRISSGVFIPTPRAFQKFLDEFLPILQAKISQECKDGMLDDNYQVNMGILIVSPESTGNSYFVFRKSNQYTRGLSPDVINHEISMRKSIAEDDLGNIRRCAPYLIGDEGFHSNWVVDPISWKPHTNPMMCIYQSAKGKIKPLIQKKGS